MTTTSQGLSSSKQFASKSASFIKGFLFSTLCTAAALTAGTTPAEAGLLVGNTQGNNVVRYDFKGNFLGEFISSNPDPSNPFLELTSPDDLVFGPNGDLFISSGSSSSGRIFRFNSRTGAFISSFGESPDLVRPYGMAFGPDGNLYVSSFLRDKILRYNGTTGEFLDVFASGNGTANGLNGPNDLLFTPDGRLLVTTQGSVAKPGDGNGDGVISDGEYFPDFLFASQILSYNITTGESSVFVDQPTPFPESFGFVSFLGMAIGPNGDLFTTDFANGIRIFDINSGGLKGAIATNYTGTDPSRNFIGNLAFKGNKLFTVGFDNRPEANNIGAILRYNGLTGEGLPSPGNIAAIFVPPNSNLQRPIGIAVTTPIPTPALIPGLIGLGAAAIRKRKAEEKAA